MESFFMFSSILLTYSSSLDKGEISNQWVVLLKKES